MGTKSKFFRVFVEGQTISDGREVTAEMIDQAVETFSRETYSPRINVEHIAGYSPEPPFNGYGDVIAVKAQDDEIAIAGKTEKRRALYAQVEANDQLVKLAAADQKPFPSVELTDSYAGTGKFGLVGLAFTDKPASVGTQRLQFSRSAPGTVFAAGADAVAIEFEGKPTDPASVIDAFTGAMARVAAMFGRSEEKPEPKPQPKPANDNFDVAKFSAEMDKAMGEQVAAAVKPIGETVAQLQSEFATLKTQLETSEAPGFSRPLATGGDGSAKFATDC